MKSYYDELLQRLRWAHEIGGKPGRKRRTHPGQHRDAVCRRRGG